VINLLKVTFTLFVILIAILHKNQALNIIMDKLTDCGHKECVDAKGVSRSTCVHVKIKKKLAGCVIIQDSKILLLHRKKTNWYELPGGKIEDGELSENAAIRELKEELGFDVTIKRKIGERVFQNNGDYLNYEWFLTNTQGVPKIMEPETFDSFKFVPINELKSHKLSTNMQEFLKELEAGNINLDYT